MFIIGIILLLIGLIGIVVSFSKQKQVPKKQ